MWQQVLRSADVHAVTANDQNLAGNADSQDYTIFYDYIFATTGDGGYSISGLSLTGKIVKVQRLQKMAFPICLFIKISVPL